MSGSCCLHILNILSLTMLITSGCNAGTTEQQAETTQDPVVQLQEPIRLDDWFHISNQPSGFLYPQSKYFDRAGTHDAAKWFNAESRTRPSRVFLEAYRNNALLRFGVDLPLGKTRERIPSGALVNVCANGYYNNPPFPEFDYGALLGDLFQRFLRSGMSPTDLGGIYLSITIEHGHAGYRVSATAPSGSVPGVFRSGAIYYDASNPDSPLNCSRAAFLEGQKLQLQMCKLAEMVRRESVRRFGSAPVVGWYNQLALPPQIRINAEGEVDGSGKTPPNRSWIDLTPAQKKTVLDRMMVNCRPLMTGGILEDDGVRYPGLDALELNAQQSIPITEAGPLDNRNLRSVDLGRRLLEERRAGADIPPVIVFSSWSFNEKRNIEEEGQLLPEAQVRLILADAYKDLEISGYLMYNHGWEAPISNCFNLQQPNWMRMTERGRTMANTAWKRIWSVVAERQGTEGLPGYRPTAQATIGTGGFSNNIGIRDAWLTTLAEFLERYFGTVLSRASQGPRIVP